MEKSFYVWVPLLSKLSIDPLVAGLVRKGLAVEPLANTDNLVSVYKYDTPCYLMAIKVRLDDKVLENHKPTDVEDEEDTKKATSSYISDMVRELCAELKIKYFCLVVSEPVGCCWNAPNFGFSSEKPQDKFEETVKTDLLGDSSTDL